MLDVRLWVLLVENYIVAYNGQRPGWPIEGDRFHGVDGGRRLILIPPLVLLSHVLLKLSTHHCLGDAEIDGALQVN